MPAGDPAVPAEAADASPVSAPPPNAAAPDFDPDLVLESYPLHPAAVRLWAWQHGIALVLALVPSTLVASAFVGAWALVLGALTALLLHLVSMRYRRIAACRFRCQRHSGGLAYRHGVWWHSEVFIPSARIQHTEVNQGPLARRYGIGKLKVFTAAAQLGALEIDGLAYADALVLRDRLLGRDAVIIDAEPAAAENPDHAQREPPVSAAPANRAGTDA